MNDFRAEVESQRPYLLRYATLQLRDSHAAEDAVQETLLAALAGEAGFRGRSNPRNWLTGILKHKIGDAHPRAPPAKPARAGEEFASPVDQKGHWVEKTSASEKHRGSL